MTETQKTTLAVYALIVVGSILMLIPSAMIVVAGLCCLTVGLLSAYIYRWRTNDVVMKDSMTYCIRTVWWSNLIILIGLAVFSSILWSNGDWSMIDELMMQADKGIIPTEVEVRAMQYQFLQNNAKLISIAAIALVPYPLYLIIRMIKGVRRTLA